jgi:hypothetical protein
MPDIVDKRRHSHIPANLLVRAESWIERFPGRILQSANETDCKVGRTNAMDETRMLSGRKDQVAEAKLAYTTQALQLLGGKELDDGGLKPPELHQAVDRVLDALNRLGRHLA